VLDILRMINIVVIVNHSAKRRRTICLWLFHELVRCARAWRRGVRVPPARGRARPGRCDRRRRGVVVGRMADAPLTSRGAWARGRSRRGHRPADRPGTRPATGRLTAPQRIVCLCA
jgi:hypothetical protein